MGDENLGYMAGNGWVTDVTDGVLVVGMCVGGDAITLYPDAVRVKDFLASLLRAG
jgi:hypothetical protein